jgi:GNAT superfamily N-acetyltransferase
MSARFPEHEAAPGVGRIVARLDALGIDARWEVGPSSPLGIEDILVQHGFLYQKDLKSMAMGLDALPDNGVMPAGLEISEASDEESLETWGKVVLANFGLDDNNHRDYSRHLAAICNAGNGAIKRYLGLLDGRPAATAVLFEGSAAAGIYWIGTLPEARSHGIGLAMTCHALHEAKQSGYKTATLNASPAGHPIYKKIGFADHYSLGIYVRKTQ